MRRGNINNDNGEDSGHDDNYGTTMIRMVAMAVL